jgi:putative ABC transport system permease protein
MTFWDTFLMALRAIARNTIRSVLTALGIVIGVASVIAMVHLGQAATLNVTQQIAAMGSNLLIVSPGVRRFGGGGPRVSAKPFELADAQAIARDVPDILVAPATTSRATAVFGNANYTTTITGTTNNFLEIRDWHLQSGRLFEDRETASGAAVCILGKTLVDNVYFQQDPLGTQLRLGASSCQVIGVLASKGSSMGNDQDDVVLMPLKAVQRRLAGNQDISTLYVSALVDGTTADTQAAIEALLRERRRIRDGAEDDFNVRDMQEIAQTLEATTGTLTALLGAIAAVSLLVGGIGIMNIMLVSVTERTREIGIRLAIGALAKDVLIQFLVEAIVIASLGGLLGVTFGVLGTWGLTAFMKLPFVLDVQMLLIAFGFAAGIGVIFGYVPARKAARLNPIDSLRHE